MFPMLRRCAPHAYALDSGIDSEGDKNLQAPEPVHRNAQHWWKHSTGSRPWTCETNAALLTARQLWAGPPHPGGRQLSLEAFKKLKTVKKIVVQKLQMKKNEEKFGLEKDLV